MGIRKGGWVGGWVGGWENRQASSGATRPGGAQQRVPKKQSKNSRGKPSQEKNAMKNKAYNYVIIRSAIDTTNGIN